MVFNSTRRMLNRAIGRKLLVVRLLVIIIMNNTPTEVHKYNVCIIMDNIICMDRKCVRILY